MKKLLIAVLVVSVMGMIAVGCAASNLYSLNLYGIACIEVASGDSDVQAALAEVGYEEGACEISNPIGKCTVNDPSFGSMTTYYSSVYSTAEAETACTNAGGSYTSL